MLLVLISARVLTFFVSLCFSPGSIFSSLVEFVFGEAAIKDNDGTMTRFKKPQRSHINNFATAILLCTCVVTLVMVPSSPKSRKSGLASIPSAANITGDVSHVKPVAPFPDFVGIGKSFGLIFIGELGDKTFFVAMILAMKYGRVPVFLGSMAALILMTILAVGVSWLVIGVVTARPFPTSKTTF